jgi:hypothetical protein
MFIVGRLIDASCRVYAWTASLVLDVITPCLAAVM